MFLKQKQGKKVRTQGKKIFSKLMPDSSKLRYLSYLPKLETFRKKHTEKYPIYEDRYKMYEYINAVVENKAIVYCEFGVFKGASIKYWANVNINENSKFYGFDTFTGLPQVWEQFTASMDKHAFDVDGEYPQIDDKRISFVKGMFQNTLPKFLDGYNNKYPLIIHNDSDLYSSTLYVLTAANSIIIPGTIIIFDEFSSILDEFRALEDYCSSYLREYEVIAATKSDTDYFTQVAVRMH